MFDYMVQYFLKIKDQKDVQYEELMNNFEFISYGALSRAFNYVADRIEQYKGKIYDMEEIGFNTFIVPKNPQETCSKSFLRLEETLKKYELPCLAFHFDECQTFIRGYTNQNLPKEGKIDTQLIPLYKFRAFCNSLKHFAYSSNVVFCFTGTRYDLKETIDLNSDLYNISGIPSIDIFDGETIEKIISHYATVSKDAFQLIIPKLIGPARNTQIFLKNSSLLGSIKGKTDFNITDVKEILENTYQWYKESYGSFLSNIHYSLAKKLSMLYFIPFAFGGECVQSKGIVTKLKFLSLPYHILEATDSGFIRAEKNKYKRNSNSFTLFFYV